MYLTDKIGDPSCPEDVVRAKRAQRQIEKKYAVTRLDDDNFDPDLGNLDEDADLSDDEPDNNGSRRNLDSQFSELESAVAEKTPLEADGTGGSAEGSLSVHGTIGPAFDAASCDANTDCAVAIQQ